MSILLLLLICDTPVQQIDMLAIEDTLFIVMEVSDHVTLYRYESTTLIVETDLGNYDNVSIGYSDGVDSQIILVACSDVISKGDNDSLYAIDPIDLSLIWKTGDLPWFEYNDPWFRTLFIERWHPEERLPRLVTYYYGATTSDSGDDQFIFSSAFDPFIYPPIWENNLFMFSYLYTHVNELFLSPVNVSTESTVTALFNRHYSPMADYWNIDLQVHEAQSDSFMRILPVSGGEFVTITLPRAFCLGSCSSHAVLLWSDTTGTVYSTEVAGSPLEILSTESVEFDLPSANNAITASHNPNDSGILVCYYRDGYIRARYMEDSWFSYEHQIAPVATVYSGCLTVSGTPDGYWIAWKDGSSYPNIAWIARETLTGISEGQSGTISDLNLIAAPNPFYGALEVTVNSYESPVLIDIYDTSGHRVHSGSTDVNGIYSWDAQGMPAGVYLIRAIQDTEFIDSKVLLIR